jgi:hypothetical protein
MLIKICLIKYHMENKFPIENKLKISVSPITLNLYQD